MAYVTDHFPAKDYQSFVNGTKQKHIGRQLQNGFIYSSTRMANSKLKNSHTIQYEDADGKFHFKEYRDF